MGICNKVGYETKSAAVESANRLRLEMKLHRERTPGKPNNRKLRPYECNRCGRWHLTSQARGTARIYKRKQRRQRDGSRSE